jgi:hypothetical protein
MPADICPDAGDDDDDDDDDVACSDSAQCDDGLFCNGIDVCFAGQCYALGNPCDTETALCDEDENYCRHVCTQQSDCCLDGDCGDLCSGEYLCIDGQCTLKILACPAGYVCDAEACVCDSTVIDCGEELCSEDADCCPQEGCGDLCTGRYACVDAQCVLNTLSCQSGFVCEESNCVCETGCEDDCQTDAECPGKDLCAGYGLCVLGQCVSVVLPLDQCENDPPPCGNGTLEAGEECDGSNLNDATCISKGFTSGN